MAWIYEKLAVEIEGAVYVQGRHTRGAGYEADCEKYSEAACLGWKVIRVTPRMIENGKLFQWLDLLLMRKSNGKSSGIIKKTPGPKCGRETHTRT